MGGLGRVRGAKGVFVTPGYSGGGGGGVLLGTWVIVKGTDTAHTPGGWGNSGKIARQR